jgi:hypothetical protein
MNLPLFDELLFPGMETGFKYVTMKAMLLCHSYSFFAAFFVPE